MVVGKCGAAGSNAKPARGDLRVGQVVDRIVPPVLDFAAIVGVVVRISSRVA